MIQKTRKAKLLVKLLLVVEVFTAFRKTAETDKLFENVEREKEKNDFQRIRCPLCQWQPGASSRWFCADADAPEFFYGGCGTMWNTFETGGKCPGCAHQWRWTSCLKCGGWARHDDWYENKKSYGFS